MTLAEKIKKLIAQEGEASSRRGESMEDWVAALEEAADAVNEDLALAQDSA